MPSYRLGEPIARLYNPLPAVSMEEIVREAGLQGLWNDRYGSAFKLQFVWSQGPEREAITIEPGQTIELPVSIANQAYSELAGMGLVLLGRDATTGAFDEEGSERWRDRVLEALQKARQFYLMRGEIPLSKARVRHGIQTDQQWDNVKIKFKGGLINKAREGRILAQLDRVANMTATPPPATATSGKVKLPEVRG